MNLLSIFQPQFMLENSSLILGHVQRILSVCNSGYLAPKVAQDDAINAVIALLQSFLSTAVANNTTFNANPSALTSSASISVKPTASIPDSPTPISVDLATVVTNTVAPSVAS